MKIDMNIECRTCHGTGVYIGMGEKDGAAIICKDCQGSGKEHFQMKYNKFKGRVPRDDVTRVFKQNPGYILSPKIIKFKISDNSGTVQEVDLSKEGISYEEFQNGKKPGYIEQLECPMLADQWSCHEIHGFVDECNKLHGSSLWGLSLNKCSYQKNKAECWKRFKVNEKCHMNF